MLKFIGPYFTGLQAAISCPYHGYCGYASTYQVSINCDQPVHPYYAQPTGTRLLARNIPVGTQALSGQHKSDLALRPLAVFQTVIIQDSGIDGLNLTIVVI